MVHIFNAPRAYPKAFAPYYEIFDFYGTRDAWEASIKDIPRPAVHLFCLHWLHLEVYNGGFWQYFFNSTGITAPEAIEGYAAIGMPEVAEVCQQAMDRVGQPYPLDREARQAVVGPPDKRMDFGDLDDAYYELADTEQFFRKRPKFVPYAETYAKAHFAD